MNHSITDYAYIYTCRHRLQTCQNGETFPIPHAQPPRATITHSRNRELLKIQSSFPEIVKASHCVLRQRGPNATPVCVATPVLALALLRTAPVQGDSKLTVLFKHVYLLVCVLLHRVEAITKIMKAGRTKERERSARAMCANTSEG